VTDTTTYPVGIPWRLEFETDFICDIPLGYGNRIYKIRTNQNTTRIRQYIFCV